MTQVLFRKANKTGTTGIWLARVRRDLQDFCPQAYGVGIHIYDKDLDDYGIRTIAINVPGYSFHIFWEI